MSDANAVNVGKMRCKVKRGGDVPGLASWSLASPGRREAQTGVSFRSHRGTLVVEKNQMLLRFCVAQRRAAKHTFVKKKERGVFSECGFRFLSKKNERSKWHQGGIED